MRPPIFSLRLRQWTSVVLTVWLSVSYSKANNPPDFDSYLVIGAFSIENNAERLMELVKPLGFEPVAQKNEKRGLIYVYIEKSDERDNLKLKAKQLRSEYTQFYDAWVYTGDFTEGFGETAPNSMVETEEVVTAQINESAPQLTKKITPTLLVDPKVDIKPKSNNLDPKENHFYFYFNAVNSKNFKEVKGKINIIDPERAKQLKIAKSHEIVELEDPENGTRRVKLATDIFGFREIQHILDLDDQESLKSDPNVDIIGDSIVVNFELERYRKGDIIVMYNVYFFKDAAIMKPESVYELNSLLDMLKENENLIVKIHGHTNGNSHGKIIHLDKEDEEYFTLGTDHKESVGSAKKLSLYRSYTIQNWLMEQGISEDRMEIKGWGGKKMIFDKHSSQAEKNVRVEIEILEE